MYTREASALDLFTDSVRIMGDATLCAVMAFDRQLDPAALEDAARACLLAHPVLHSRLVRGDGPARWELDGNPRLPPLQAEVCTGDYRPRVPGPVDPAGPLQVRVRLLRQPPGDVVIVNLSHAAADASGLHTLMAQLLQEYEQPGSLPPATGGIPERDTLWTARLAGEPAAPDGMRVVNPLWPDPFGTSRQPTSFHRECIGEPALRAIRDHARRLGGSLNDAVVAAYFLAMTGITGYDGPIDIFFPVNLRQHLRDGSRVMSNQATNVCIPLSRASGEGMEAVLPRVIERTRALKARRIGIAEQAAMDRACDPEGRQIRQMVEEMAVLQRAGLADIFLSNPGQVDLPGIPGLTDAYVCYPGGYMPATCFVTSTFRGRMTITMGYQDSERPREGTRRAMHLFREHLLSLADGAEMNGKQ